MFFFFNLIFTISVCVESKTRKTDIFVFHQLMQENFHLYSNKFIARPFSFSVYSNPSLILIIIIFISVVRPVACS